MTRAQSAFALLAGLLLLCIRIGQVPSLYDEGLILVGADRILLGEVPFRDFWNTHPPGQIWIVAALFRAVGESVIVLRVYDVIVKTLLALAVWRWAARLGVERLSVVAFAAAVLWLESSASFGYAAYPALLCGLTSLLLVTRALRAPDTERPRALMVGAGVVTGIGTVFHLDFGIGAAAAAALTIAMTHASAGPLPASQRLRRAIRELALFAAGAGVPVLLCLAVLLAQGVAASSLFEILVVFPTTIFPEVRRLPAPALSWKTLAFYVPACLGVLGLVRGIVLLRRRGGGTAAPAWCGLSLLVLAGIPQARIRADVVHQLPVVVPSIALAAAWVHDLFRGTALRRTGALLLACLLALTYLVVPADYWRGPLPFAWTHPHGVPRAALVLLPPDQAAAVRAVRAHTADSDFIFVGNGRHDRSVANDALFYFLAGRRYPTFYHNLLPGVITLERVQQRIISDLEARGVRYVVLSSVFDGSLEPNASRMAGSSALDEYIRRAYGLSATCGRYQIWVRR